MKKKILLCIALGLFSLQVSSQIFYNGEKLRTSKIEGNRVGNVVGAYFTIGISSAKSYKIIEGDTSETEISEKKPEFKFSFMSKKDSLFLTNPIRQHPADELLHPGVCPQRAL